MENGPNADFEMLFYNGWKFIWTLSNLQTIEPNGQASNWPLTKGDPTFDRDVLQDLWRHLNECHAHCIHLESTIEQIAKLAVGKSSLPFFPLTIGRKPSSTVPNNNKISICNKENQVSEPVLSGLKSFDGSVRSAVSSASKNSVRRLDQQKPGGITQMEVPGIGRVIQKSQGKYLFRRGIAK